MLITTEVQAVRRFLGLLGSGCPYKRNKVPQLGEKPYFFSSEQERVGSCKSSQAKTNKLEKISSRWAPEKNRNVLLVYDDEFDEQDNKLRNDLDAGNCFFTCLTRFFIFLRT